MRNPLRSIVAAAFALVTTLSLNADMPQGANRTAAPTAGGDKDAIVERATRRAVLAQARTAAAKRAKAALAAKGGKVDPALFGKNPSPRNGAEVAANRGLTVAGVKGAEQAMAIPGPGFQLSQPDYMFGTASNWHNTKPIHKFVDSLAGIGAAQANNLGNYIPVAAPNRDLFPDSDYYEIDVVEYKQKVHSELEPTTFRGYVEHGAVNTTPGITAGTRSNYLGPIIVAKKDRAVRIKMRNLLPFGPVNPTTGRAPGDIFLPVDTTMMGSGLGANLGTEVHTQNRVEFHLHGGLNPWISDGTPHQWITPAGETTSYPKGVVFQNVPDMVTNSTVFPTPPAPGDGIATYFYSNQQSGRLLWYHDHAYGLTRLNAYAGQAAGYLLVDPTEVRLINQGILPSPGSTLPIAEDPWDTAAFDANTHPVNPPLVNNVYTYGIPLVIQDKTFVDESTLGTLGVQGGTDPTWSVPAYGGDGSLWFPHVYIPNQNPADISGANATGRWDYGPWFWPPLTSAAGLQHPAEPIPGDPNGTEIPGTPNPSLTPEAFMDTPVINGVAYPYINVQPTAYRFRILAGGNDRFWNLSFFQADPAAPTEVKMLPAAPNPAWPATWPADGRAGGVPDPSTAGPSFIQIGNESGFLATPVVIAPQPVSYNYNRRDIVVLNVADKGLFLGPAERADVVVDFSAYAGQTLILYNDAPAPVPAFDPRLDYYTGDPDQRDSGGANTTAPGFGPNTRTLMQFRVAAATPSAPFDVVKLFQAFESTSTSKGAFAESQHTPIVPQLAYQKALNKPLYAGANAAYGNDVYFRIQDFQSRYPFPNMENGTLTTPSLEPKAIQELFELDYGRMNATLGVELARTNFNIQTTIPLGYIDSPTEILTDGTTQYWKITHNGVDTHPVHFHLFDVQVVNRVGWDGAVRMPEPAEIGWKETVKMNPLEDVIVAFRPLSPRLPFAIPNSERELNVLEPNGTLVTFTDPLTGNPIQMPNTHQSFGWEYVWHCHILGHEENDFMRPLVLNVATTLPAAPSNLTAAVSGNHINMAWTDHSTNETGFSVERGPSASGPWTEIATTLPNQHSYSDYGLAAGTTYWYRVASYNQKGASAYTAAQSVASSAQISLAGMVSTFDGLTTAPLGGVSLSITGSGTVTSAVLNGAYSAQVTSGWAGTITPALAGFAFTPASRTLAAQTASRSDLGFTARPVQTISGTVFGNGAPLAGVTVTLSGGAGSGVTDASGVYTVQVDTGWSGRAVPSKANTSFAPAYLDYTNVTGNLVAQNYDATAVLTISGNITTTGSSPASGVTLSFNGVSGAVLASGTVTTDVAGNYSITVPSPWNGLVTPAQTGSTFTPASITYNAVSTDQLAQNYVSSGSILITGTIVDSLAAALSGVTLTASSGHTTTTNASGVYSFYLPAPFTGTVTPSKSGYVFTPTSTAYTAQAADLAAQNYTAGAVITVSGRVTLNAVGLAGATATLSTGETALTDINGNYTLTVPRPYSGNISVAKAGYFITPASLSILSASTNQTGLNFTAVTAIPVTGQILAGGLPLANVVVTFSNNGGAYQTNASGVFTGSVPSRWSGSITPSLAGYTFTPALRNLTNVTTAPAAQNFTAAAIYAISGNVINGALPLAGVRLTLSNAGGSVTTNAAGAYSINVPAGWTGTITPVLRGYTFSPTAITVPAVGANLAALDFFTVRTISGTTRNRAGVSVPGVTITYTGGTVLSSATGTFTITVPTGWTGTLSASGGVLTTWTPASFTYTNLLANVTGLRFTGQ